MGQPAPETEITTDRQTLTPLSARTGNLDPTRDSTWGKGARSGAIKQGEAPAGQRVLTAGSLYFGGDGDPYQQILDEIGRPQEKGPKAAGDQRTRGSRDQLEARLYSIF